MFNHHAGCCCYDILLLRRISVAPITYGRSSLPYCVNCDEGHDRGAGINGYIPIMVEKWHLHYHLLISVRRYG